MKITHRYLARITIEAVTPFHIGSGWEGEVSDAAAVTDANGLPALPGTSIAGVLRSLFESAFGPDATRQLFGYQRRQEGQGSRLSVSWGFIHDSKNLPVEGLVPPDNLNDEVLRSALNPTLRDHVLIEHRGVSDAAKRGKFDELAICAGYRFTFELELAGDAKDSLTWKRILDLLTQPEIRLGGKTRRGFGCFKVIAISEHDFDLHSAMTDYLNHPVSLQKPAPSLQKYQSNSSASSSIKAELILEPRGYWMFGGGEDIKPGEADMAPVRDQRIVWNNNNATVDSDIIYVPGSSVKGALAHRVAFHYNAIKGVFADEIGSDDIEDKVGANNDAVRELFGYAKDRADSSNRDGRRGIVMIDDVFVKSEPDSHLIPHVSINRFTGGALESALFSERPLWKGKSVRINIAIDANHAQSVTNDTRKALKSALEDLAQGRLQLGGGSGRGHGFFEAKQPIAWSDGGTWIDGGQS